MKMINNIRRNGTVVSIVYDLEMYYQKKNTNNKILEKQLTLCPTQELNIGSA